MTEGESADQAAENDRLAYEAEGGPMGKALQSPLTTMQVLSVCEMVLVDLFNARDLEGVQVSTWHEGEELMLRLVVKVHGKKKILGLALNADDLLKAQNDLFEAIKEAALQELIT